MNKQQTEQLNRMHQMMTYGTIAEAKSQPFKSIEYEKAASDGRNYAIIREGVKYYIKVSDKKKPLKEDYDYVGGFRNRKNYEYDSYANALKQFDLKMMSLREANNKKGNVIVESWVKNNPNTWATEVGETMQNEISRMRQIMTNAAMISEGKSGCVKGDCSTPKNNIKKNKASVGSPLGNGGDPYDKNPEFPEGSKDKNFGKPNRKKEFKPVLGESSEVLAWNDDPNYLDVSSGTQIGSSAPFTKKVKSGNNKAECKNGVCCDDECVNEGVALYDEGDDQNSPEVGTNKIGDSAPFTKKVSKKINESEEEDIDVEEESFDDDEELEDFEDDEVDIDDLDDDSEDFEDEDLEDDFDDDLDTEMNADNEEIESLRSEMEDLKSTINAIADKLGVNEFEDEELYDDDSDEETEYELDIDDTDDGDEEEIDMDVEEYDDDDMEDDDTEEVFESKSYKKLMIQEGKKMDNLKKGAKKVANGVKKAVKKGVDAYKKHLDDTEFECCNKPNFGASDREWDEYDKKKKSRSSKVNEERLDMFGKHPAYRKKVMTLPSNKIQDKDGYYDMNDSSVDNDLPFGTSIGDGAPFDIDPETIANSIAESFNHYLERKNH